MNKRKSTGKPEIKSGNTASVVQTEIVYSQVFLFVIFISCLFMTRNVLDFTLVPRFLILSAGLFVVWMLAGKKMISKEFRPGLIDIGFAGYLAVNLFSIIWSTSKDAAYFDSLKIVVSVLVYYFTRFYLSRDPLFEQKLSRVLSVVLGLYLLVAVYQLFQLESFKLFDLYNISSLTGHKNLFSCFLLLSFPFTFYVVLSDKGFWRILGIANGIIALLFIALLQTRAAWFGIAGGGVVFILLLLLKQNKASLVPIVKWASVVLCALALFIGVFLFSASENTRNEFLSRLDVSSYSNSRSGAERLAIWKKTIMLWKEYPVAGVGAGNWQIHYPKNSVAGIETVEFENQTFQRPHNDYLWVLAETGIIGFVFFLLVMFVPLVTGVRDYLTQKFSPQSFITLVYVSIVAAFLIVSFFDFPRERLEILTVSSLLIALVTHRSAGNFKLSNKQISLPGMPVFTVVSALLIFCVVVAVARFKGELNMTKVYTFRASGNWERMRHYCDKAVSPFYTIDPTTIPVNWYKGLAFFSEGDYKNALKEYQAAQNISPYNHYILNDLASAYELNGDHKKAKHFFLRSLAINPSFDDPKLNLAAIYFNDGAYQKAWNYTKAVRTESERKKLFIKTIQPFIK